MVNSRPGRTEPPEVGKRRPQTRRTAEAENRDVGQPGPLLRLVDAESLEPLVQINGQPRRAPVLVGEDEHADAAGLLVANGPEHDRARGGCRSTPESTSDPRQPAR